MSYKISRVQNVGLCRCNLILCRKQQKLGKRSSCAMDFSVISASSHMHNFCNFLVTLDWKTKKYTNDSFTYRACNTLASHKFSVRVRKFRFCMLINTFVYISNLVSYVWTIRYSSVLSIFSYLVKSNDSIEKSFWFLV